MATLHVKGMDEGLYRALAARAAQDRRSISEEVMTIIRDYLARPSRSALEKTEGFLELCGTWADDRDPAEIARDLRRARRGRRVEAIGVLD